MARAAFLAITVPYAPEVPHVGERYVNGPRSRRLRRDEVDSIVSAAYRDWSASFDDQDYSASEWARRCWEESVQQAWANLLTSRYGARLG